MRSQQDAANGDAGGRGAASTVSNADPRPWGPVVAPASAVAAGRSLWVEEFPNDPSNRMIDASVDVGSLHRVGEALEARVDLPSAPGTLSDFRHNHPQVAAPDGSYARYVARSECGLDGPLDYRVEEAMVAPDGTVLWQTRLDFVAERTRKATETAEWAKKNPTLPFHGYGRDYSSLMCAAAAAKCRGEPLRWPPPSEAAPPGYSGPLGGWRRAYDAPFVPSCQL